MEALDGKMAWDRRRAYFGNGRGERLPASHGHNWLKIRRHPTNTTELCVA